MARYVKVVNFSDLHLGTKKNPTSRKVKTIRTIFTSYAELRDVDIMTFSGDVFDKLLSTNSDDWSLSIEILIFIAKFCQTHNIKMRILNGTTSHDMNQCRVLDTIFRESGLTVDFKYVDTISIEYLKDEDISILYVPDDMGTSEDVTEKIKELIAKTGRKIDIALMHGSFSYQLPYKDSDGYDMKTFIDLVKYIIIIGHHHDYSTFDKIVAPGALDRKQHNEEKKKGFIICTIDKILEESSLIFIENINAMTFLSTTVKTKKIETLIKNIYTLISKLREGSHIALVVDSKNPIIEDIPLLVNKFKTFNFTINKKYKEVSNSNIEETIYVPTMVELTEKNIKQLLLDRVTLTKYSEEELTECLPK